MPANVKIRWNTAAFDKILHSTAVDHLTRTEAERLATEARAIAAPFRVTGQYESSIHVETMAGSSRNYSRVVASAPYSLKIERKYGVLSRALAAVGM